VVAVFRDHMPTLRQPAGDCSVLLAPVLRSLKRLNYTGWISLEAFDFTPGAERIAETWRLTRDDLDAIRARRT